MRKHFETKCKGVQPRIIQDDRILQLCQWLNKFTLDEIVTINELEQYNNKPTPVSKGRIEKNLNLMFEFRTPQEQEIIIKGFCLEIPPQKL